MEKEIVLQEITAVYQDKKEQVQNHQKKTPFQVLFLFRRLYN